MTERDGQHKLAVPVLAVYDQPVSTQTLRSGWVLLAVSGLCISSTIFGLKFKQLFGFTIEETQSNMGFQALFTLLVLLLIFPHVLNCLNDLLRKRDVDAHILYLINQRKALWLRDKARVEYDAATSPPNDDEDDPYTESVFAESNQQFEKSERKLALALDRLTSTSWPIKLRALRFWSHTGTPILVSLIAIWTGREYLNSTFQEFAQHVVWW